MNAREQLASYLKMLQRRLRLGTLLRGVAALLAVALTATLVLVLITNAFGFSDSSLFAARIALVLALATVVGYGVALPWRALNDRRAARKAEAAFPQFDQRLVTFAERDRGGRDPFLELLAADTLQVAKSAQPESLVPKGKLLAWIASGGTALVLLVWMIAAGPGFLGYGAARLWAGSLQHTAPFYDIRVSPGNAAVRRSANQLVTAQVIGRQVESARLYARYQSASKWEEVTMQRQPAGNGFQFLFAGLPESVDYYIEAGPFRSRNFKLRVVDGVESPRRDGHRWQRGSEEIGSVGRAPGQAGRPGYPRRHADLGCCRRRAEGNRDRRQGARCGRRWPACPASSARRAGRRGRNWSGRQGYTSGLLPLGTPAEKDVGFPYADSWGAASPAVTAAMAGYSWQRHLIARGAYADWVDRGRLRPTHRQWSGYLRDVAERAEADIRRR